MGKKTEKAKPAAAAAGEGEGAAAAKPKRKRLKLALAGLAVLALAGGGGAFGWMHFMGGKAATAESAHGEAATEGHGEAEGHHAEAGDAHEPAHKAPDKAYLLDATIPPPEVKAETSFTHGYALSVLLAGKCAPVEAKALKAASDKEAEADGTLATLSWQAAARRIGQVTERSCNKLVNEVLDANARAASGGAEKKVAAKGGH